MRIRPMVLAGPIQDVIDTLTAAKYGPRLLRVTATDDGENVKVDILPTGQEQFRLDGNVPQPSVIVSAPNSRAALVIEGKDMTAAAATAAMKVIGQSAYNADGLVTGSAHRDVLMPTPADSYDRAVLRDLDSGALIATVEIPNIDDQVRLTAAFAANGPTREQGITAIGVIGQSRVYAIDPAKHDGSTVYMLDESNAQELPSPIVRAARNDETGYAEFILQDGSTAAFRADDFGQLKLAALTAAQATDTIGSPWQLLGSTAAIGNGRASVQPGPGSVEYRLEQAPAPQ